MLLVHEPVVRYAALLHNALDAVDVLLRNALADVDADAVVAADSHFLQVDADVVHVPLPRADGVVLPTEAVEVASPFPDARLGAAVLGRRASQQDGQVWVDVALHIGGYLHGLGDEVDSPRTHV